MMNKKQNNHLIQNYGGQALIEGVLMRGKNYLAAAMRSPNGEIIVKTEELGSLYKGKISKIPFFRGLVILWDALALGMKYLAISSNLQSETSEEKIEGASLYFSLILTILFTIGIFFVLPTLLMSFINKFWQFNIGASNLFEGLMRLILLISYIWSIGKMKDVARVFAYHGAEHKTINAYEDGVKFNVKNVMKYPVEHPRCGTSFLITLIVLSIVIFSLLGPMSLFWRISSRVLLIPILSMFAYEIIRWFGYHTENPIVKALVWPNLMMQKLTTREPTEDIVEVSIKAFNELMKLEKQSGWTTA